MYAREAKSVHEKMLEGSAEALDPPSFQAAWTVFKAFAHLTVEDHDVDPDADGDLLLFQAGKRDLKKGILPSGETSAYKAEFVRQFSFTDADGEYRGMEQLHLSLVAPLSPTTTVVPEATVWGTARPRRAALSPAYEGIQPDLPAWTAAVEAEPAFDWACNSQIAKALLHQTPI